MRPESSLTAPGLTFSLQYSYGGRKYHRSIVLDGFEIPEFKPINVIFSIAENDEIKISAYLKEIPKDVTVDEAKKSEEKINELLKYYYKDITREFSEVEGLQEEIS